MRGETRRKARRCIHRRSIAARIAAKTTGAAAQGAGERPSHRAPRRTPEGAMRGHGSGRSGTDRSRVRRVAQDSTPTAYMYTPSGRVDGEAARPERRARLPKTKPHIDRQTSTAPLPDRGRTLEGKPARHSLRVTRQGLPLRKLGLRCSSGNCRAPSSECRRSTHRRRRPCACPSKSTPSTSFPSRAGQRP